MRHVETLHLVDVAFQPEMRFFPPALHPHPVHQSVYDFKFIPLVLHVSSVTSESYIYIYIASSFVTFMLLNEMNLMRCPHPFLGLQDWIELGGSAITWAGQGSVTVGSKMMHVN